MVSLFSRNETIGKNPKFQFNLATVTLSIILVLVLIQVIGALFGDALGFSVALGPTFILMAVVLLGASAFVIVKKLMTDRIVDRKDIFAVLLVAVISLVVILFLRELVPEAFARSASELLAVVKV